VTERPGPPGRRNQNSCQSFSPLSPAAFVAARRIGSGLARAGFGVGE
jgi:hypothetical protein